MRRTDREFLLDILEAYKDVEWKDIAGMRDKLIHFYFGVKLEIVWVVATKEISELESKIKEILEKEG